MFHYSIEEWLLLFYIYCFLGWCFESGWVSFRTKHWVNRGFLRAPFLPLYGSGAIMMLVVSRPFADNIFLTYISGCIGATILEFVTGVTMEYLFKIRYWDYSYQRFNYKGHICLSSTIAWGFLTILMTRVIHEPIEAFVLQLPETVVTMAALLLTVVLTWDFALSFKAAMDLREVLEKLEEARNDLEELYARFRAIVDTASEQVQNAASGRGARLDGLREELAEIRGDIQAELTASFEVRISRLHDFAEKNNLDSLEEVREEYRQWRRKFYENSQKRFRNLELQDKFKRHHILDNPTMRSDRFKGALEDVRSHIQNLKDKK